MSNDKYENTYDIEFCVSVPVFYRVQAHSIEQAMKIAHDRYQNDGIIIFTPRDMDKDIVMIRKREDICDLGATTQDMVYEYNYLKRKAK